MKNTALALGALSAALLAGCVTASSPRLGVAGYTFHKKTLDQTLDVMSRADIHYLCVKDFHLAYTASDAEIAAFKAKCRAKGVEPYALGPLYTRKVSELRPYFEFARRFGAKVIVGVPCEPSGKSEEWNELKASREQLLEIDRLVKEFDIRYAIHNHGPQVPMMFPDADFGWALIKDLDPRIGFCLDVGWEYACGKDPAETIRRYGDRIFDVHIKDFEIGKPNGTSIPLGRGKLDYVAILEALRDVRYPGVCALEYERDFEDNAVPVAECAGYYRGITQAAK